MKNFLLASEVKVFVKNAYKITEYPETWQNFTNLNFKNPVECLFSFDKKRFAGRTVIIQSACVTYSWCRRMIYILRMYAYDVWKSLYERLKSKSLPKNDTKLQNILKLGRSSETLISKIHLKVIFSSIKNVSLVARSSFKVRHILKTRRFSRHALWKMQN